MGKELLLEIGTEEIPAAFLPKALRDLEEIARGELAANRIRHGEIRTMGTPRRLFLTADGLAEQQEDQVIEKLGPAARVAFDEQGNPLPRRRRFRQRAEPRHRRTGAGDDGEGEYLCARKKILGEATVGLLPAILTKVITGIPFRKSMRWSDQEFRFARPIHWILALFGGRIVPFRIANVESGNTSRGHRFMSPDSFPVGSREEYLTGTRNRFVIVDPAERKEIIREETGRRRQPSAAASFRPRSSWKR